MELRKLDASEHGITRKLWEAVFTEDSKAFLDYYYFFKTRENEIYVIEEDGAVRSMLHLNPYTVQVGKKAFTAHYIIAVATENAYRKRGYMGMLLQKSIQEMYARKEPFTFLMPAAEAIYTPYDFRFVYDQSVQKLSAANGGKETGEKNGEKAETEVEEKNGKRTETEVKAAVLEAGMGDGAELAEFFERNFADAFQVYAVRDEAYYQTMLFEQQSEGGGIVLLKQEDETVGTFLYGDEDGLEVREPLILKGYEDTLVNVLRSMCKERKQDEVTVYAGGELAEATERIEKPTIMVRILHLESLLHMLNARKGEQIDCSFAVLDPLLPQNSRIWRIQSKKGQKDGLEVLETEDSEGVLTIAALTSLLFGYKSPEEVVGEEDVILTEHLIRELSKLEPLHRIYLNEIV